jgi:hypothetical protein
MTAGHVSRQRAQAQDQSPCGARSDRGFRSSSRSGAAFDINEPPVSAARETHGIEPFYILKEAAGRLNCNPPMGTVLL